MEWHNAKQNFQHADAGVGWHKNFRFSGMGGIVHI